MPLLRGGQGGVLLPSNSSEASNGEVNQHHGEQAGVSRPTYEALKDVIDHGTEALKDVVREKKLRAELAAAVAAAEREAWTTCWDTPADRDGAVRQ